MAVRNIPAFCNVVRVAERPFGLRSIFSISLFAVMAVPMWRATDWVVVLRLRRRVKGLPS
ncbi:MAG: hypothetical protein DI530_05035 [Sphingomonas sp.]|uniref:Uncharacterized protein n=1 Tax=Sphingomonas adhaesiva TaxID=28212 RepID=A0A2A4I939_9SPHN|nr:hypothetical protein COA07_11015 [Sphingomonas adhaesiva]PZU80640.1 MAG: hypothetical protein DI530_05035 [Sphingomonas sp.]